MPAIRRIALDLKRNIRPAPHTSVVDDAQGSAGDLSSAPKSAQRASCRSTPPAACANSSCATACAFASSTARATTTCREADRADARHHLQRRQVLAKESEEQLLYRDMQSDMVQQICAASPRRQAAADRASSASNDALRAEQLARALARSARAALRHPRRRAAARARGGRRDPRRGRTAGLRRARSAHRSSAASTGANSLHAGAQPVAVLGDKSWSSCAFRPASPAPRAREPIAAVLRRACFRTCSPWSSLPRAGPRRPKTSAWFKRARARRASLIKVPGRARAACRSGSRARLARQRPDARRAKTLEFLADRVEGNLLAAHQEIQKLGCCFRQASSTSKRCAAPCSTSRATTRSG